MSTPSEFMEARARADDGRESSRVRSTSQGPAVVLRGRRQGMDKVAVTKLLQSYGMSRAEAHNAAEGVLRGKAVTIHLRTGADSKLVRHELDRLGGVL